MNRFINKLKKFASRHEALIINYHSVISRKLEFQIAQHLPIEEFEMQMEYLKKHFYCLSVTELLNNIKSDHSIPYSIAITFDDGYHNNFTNALPLLEKYEIPATIFAVTDYLEKKELLWPELLASTFLLTKHTGLKINDTNLTLLSPTEKEAAYKYVTRYFKQVDAVEIPDHLRAIQNQLEVSDSEIYHSQYYDEFKFMTWPILRQMSRSKFIDVGSHTRTHKRLSRITKEESRLEIAGSKSELEREIGNINLFAYPFGSSKADFNPEHINLVAESGYRAALSADYGTVYPPVDIYKIPRVNINSQDRFAGFKYLVNGGAAFDNSSVFSRAIRGIITGITK